MKRILVSLFFILSYANVQAGLIDSILKSVSGQHKLANMAFNYGKGLLSTSIGNGQMSVIEEEEEGVRLKFEVHIRVLGKKIDYSNALTDEELNNGASMKFYLPGQDSHFLEISSDGSFDQNGGDIVIWYWNNKWEKLEFAVRKVGAKFEFFHKTPSYSKRIKNLDVTISGMSLSSIQISNVKIH
jgi:hypothetical protein